MIKIIKRDGRKEDLDITKIQKMTIDATGNLVGVSQSELELDAQLKFVEGMSSADIQDALIKTAVEKIDIDVPNWTFVAARLFIFDLYHRVGKISNGVKGIPYCHLRDYFTLGQSNQKIILGLEEGYDLDDLNDYIKPERDYLFNYLGIKTLYDRYLIKNKEGEPIELPQHMFMGISMFLAQNEENKQQRAKEFYDVISSFEVMLATPTLSNARTNRHQLSSCYIGSTPDNIEGIFDSYHEMALLSKHGGGIGWDWNKVRALGGVIDNHKKAAGGTVPFLKITNDVAIAVDQLGCVSRGSYVEVLNTVTINKESSKENIDIQMIENENNFKRFETKIGFNELELATYLINNNNFKYSNYSNEQLIKSFSIYIKTPKRKNARSLIQDYLVCSKDSVKNLSKKFGKFIKSLEFIPDGYKVITYKNLNDYICNKFGDIRCKKTLKPLFQNSLNKKRNHLDVDILGKKYSVSRIIYFTWSESKNYEFNVDHKDNNKWNNHYLNLQEISHEENISIGWDEGNKENRINKSRIRKYLSKGYKLNGHKINIEDIKILSYNYINIKIEDVQKDMFVKSFNIKTQQPEPKLVLETHTLQVKKENQTQLRYIDGGYTNTSDWHKSLVYRDDEFKYIRADEVIDGDIGIDENNNKCQYISSIKPGVSENYCDLEVQDNNNYFCTSGDIDSPTHVIHNTRKGAIAVYLEPWHMDIIDFIDLKKNSGEERRRAHDLFPALWITDLFMERVLEDSYWTLFDPYEVKDLSELHGDAFKAKYLEYEADETITKDRMKAKDLWKKILTSYFESGSPFLCFKDNANRANPNNHVGFIHSSNLCTEIFQNTKENEYKIQFQLETNNSVKPIELTELFDESSMISCKNNIKSEIMYLKDASKVSTNDYILYNNKWQKVYFQDRIKIDGETAVCNLASVNLSKINTEEDIKRVVPTAVRMLDNVINLNFYPVLKTKKANSITRAIGLGVMGEAQMIAEKQIMFGSKEHFNLIDKVMENISFYTINASSDLAIEKGAYPAFDGSKWSKGIFPIDSANKECLALTDKKPGDIEDKRWLILREKVISNGVRNGYMMAIAPTSSISILVGTTQAIEPVYKRKWYEENLSGLIPVVVPNLSPETYQYYTPAFEVDQLQVVKAAAIRQKWIDQGQSTNIFMLLANASGKFLNDIYMLAWKLGLKSTYYLRSQSPEANNDVEDRSMECSGCQ